MLLKCDYCGISFDKETKEYNRKKRQGSDKFYCSSSCCGNARAKVVEWKDCECGEKFEFRMKGTKSYCSRTCANHFAYRPRVVSQKMRDVGKQIAEIYFRPGVQSKGMQKREEWRFLSLKTELEASVLSFSFEYPIEKYLFDLAVWSDEIKLLIEYDEPYHNWRRQRKIDYEKDSVAKKSGWRVIRVPVSTGSIYPVDVTLSLLKKEFPN